MHTVALLSIYIFYSQEIKEKFLSMRGEASCYRLSLKKHQANVSPPILSKK